MRLNRSDIAVKPLMSVNISAAVDELAADLARHRIAQDAIDDVGGQVSRGRIDEAIEMIGGLLEQRGRRRSQIKLPFVEQ